MRRRDFIKVIVGSATAWPLAAGAQQPDRVRRLGVMMSGPSEADAEGQARVQLVINLKTAKALGLTAPPALLAAADEVIE